MSTCIVHFGMHKTGSSSLQRTLFRLRERGNWVYVHAGQANSGLALRAAFSASRADRNFHRLGARVDAGSEVLHALEQCFARPAETYVLSAEGLCEWSEEDLSALFGWLRTRVDTIRGLGYVRPVQGFLESAFQQRLKAGVIREPSLEDVRQAYPGYRARLEKFDTLLGRSQVELVLFKTSALREGDVVRDFASRIGIELAAEEVVRANESLSFDAQVLVHLTERSLEGAVTSAKRGIALRLIVARLRHLAGRPLRFSASLVDPILHAHQDDLDWIEARLGASLREVREARPGEEIDDLEVLKTLTPLGLVWLRQQMAKLLPGRPPLGDAPTPEAIQAALRGLAKASLFRASKRQRLDEAATSGA